MTIDILINAQTYENYATKDGYIDTDNPFWKPKGGSFFKVTVDDFWLMYAEKEEIAERFGKLMESQSNGMFKYEYVGDHTILWGGIEEIDGVIE